MEITLRDFRRSDFEILWKIDQECFPSGIAYSRHELSSYIQRRGAFSLVAEAAMMRTGKMEPEEGDPAGIVGFLVAEKQRSVGHIVTVDVVALARRAGAGSQLLIAAEDRLRAAQCLRVRLEAAVNNAAALAFYARHQYQTVTTIPGYYSTGLDAFSLEKEL